MVNPGRESGLVQSFPKSIARSTEVMADHNAVKAGVDATKEDFKIWPDDVGHCLAMGGGKLLFGGAFSFFHSKVSIR